MLKFGLSYIFWAYIFVVGDLDEGSRIHTDGLNLSPCLNVPSYFTNHIIWKLKLNFPLFILFTRGRTETSTWHCTTFAPYLFSFFMPLIIFFSENGYTLQFSRSSFQFFNPRINSILIWSITMSFFRTFSKIIRGA